MTFEIPPEEPWVDKTPEDRRAASANWKLILEIRQNSSPDVEIAKSCHARVLEGIAQCIVWYDDR